MANGNGDSMTKAELELAYERQAARYDGVKKKSQDLQREAIAYAANIGAAAGVQYYEGRYGAKDGQDILGYPASLVFGSLLAVGSFFAGRTYGPILADGGRGCLGTYVGREARTAGEEARKTDDAKK